jgi:hypothetical protein
MHRWRTGDCDGGGEHELTSRVVILSGVRAVRRKALTESKDPFELMQRWTRRGILSTAVRFRSRNDMSTTYVGRMLGVSLAFWLAGVPAVCAQRPSKGDISSHSSILGFMLEKSSFADVQGRLGATKIGQCAWEAEPTSYIGYVSLNPGKTKILFESSRFDPHSNSVDLKLSQTAGLLLPAKFNSSRAPSLIVTRRRAGA